jgi:hypothetical protein
MVAESLGICDQIEGQNRVFAKTGKSRVNGLFCCLHFHIPERDSSQIGLHFDRYLQHVQRGIEGAP